jgi:hypothetical protein
MIVIAMQPARSRQSAADPAALPEPFDPPLIRQIGEDSAVGWLLALRPWCPADRAFLLRSEVERRALYALLDPLAAPHVRHQNIAN